MSHYASAAAAVLLASPLNALAFCGSYVGGSGTDLYNNASQIAVVRQGNETTLTMASDVEADSTDFAIVIPVPEVLNQANVRVVDPEVIRRLDAYSSPRLVSYTCEQLGHYPAYDTGDYGYPPSSAGCLLGGCSNDSMIGASDTDAALAADGTAPLSPEDIDSVGVEANFAVGEYEIVILSAEESGDLLLWLELSGYAVDPATEDLFAEYIDAGSYFFAAKVHLEEAETGDATIGGGPKYLSPIQFTYRSDVWSLPIRLGTTNSPGVQDAVFFVVNTAHYGQAGISNYPEASIEDECLFDTHAEDATFGEFYEREFAATHERSGQGIWSNEYSWGPTKCDPCTSQGALSDEDLQAIGWDRDPWDAWFTRLRVRYTPEEATQDLVFYHTNMTTNGQIRHIEYERSHEWDFPTCAEGWVDDPGTCDSAHLYRQARPKAGGQASAAGVGILLGLALVGFRRRREQD